MELAMCSYFYMRFIRFTVCRRKENHFVHTLIEHVTCCKMKIGKIIFLLGFLLNNINIHAVYGQEHSCGTNNIALNATTTASSVYVSNIPGKAVDGNNKTNTAGWTECFHADKGLSQQWIAISLSAMINPCKILILPETRNLGRLDNSVIGLMDSMPAAGISLNMTQVKVCATTGTVSPGQWLEFQCNHSGSVLVIAGPQYLTVCEVEVYEDSRLYPFGLVNGDAIIPYWSDSYGPIILSTMFPFFNTTFYGIIFININGAFHIATDRSYEYSDAFPTFGESSIAGYWTDVDNEEGHGGTIYYRLTNDSTIMNRLNKDIYDSQANITGFSGLNECVIATWYFVPPWGANVTMNNTFQIIVGTDGTHSFAEFIYDKLMWSDAGLFNVWFGNAGHHARIGFNSGDGILGYEVPGSGTANVSELYSYSKHLFKIDGIDIIKLV